MKQLILSLFSLIMAASTHNPYPCDKFGELSIYSVTHGSVVLSTPDATIIIDPVMNLGGKKFQYSWFRPSGNGAILITHEHHDHLSKEAVDYFGPIQVFGNHKAVEVLGQGEVMHNGDTVSIAGGEVHIKAVPAYNTTNGRQKFHPKGNGNGYLIEIGELVVYVAGDTEAIPEMKELGKVDIALLPVNQPYTMTPEQCIIAAKMINPKVLIPYHMGDTDMTPVIEEFKGSDIKVIFHEELR